MRCQTFAAFVSVMLVSAVSADLSAQEVRRYINARSATDSTALPFSGAVLVGNTLYLSGTIDDGRPRVGAGVLLRRCILRCVQCGLSHVFHERVSSEGLHRCRYVAFRSPVRGARRCREAVSRVKWVSSGLGAGQLRQYAAS